jgi:hypothetical protein
VVSFRSSELNVGTILEILVDRTRWILSRFFQICNSKLILNTSRYSDGLDGPGSIPGSVRYFSSCQPPIQWVPGVILPVVKRLGIKDYHSPQTSAEVEEGGAVPPLPHTSSWHGVH